jgi:hypothetical protein
MQPDDGSLTIAGGLRVIPAQRQLDRIDMSHGSLKRRLLLASLVAIATSGCVVNIHRSDPAAGFDPTTVRRPDPKLPKVFVDRDRFLVVDQEPIRLFKEDVSNGRVTLTWQLDATSRITFPQNAVTFQKPVGGDSRYQPIVPTGLECKLGEKAKTFSCSFAAPRGKWQTKYTVSALDGKEPVEILDPTILGDM